MASLTEVTSARDTIGEVVDDVTAGRRPLGVVPTEPDRRSKHGRLQPIVTFGAERNVILSKTPTFAEVTGNPKLAFTESVGVFASPKLEPALANRLTQAFMAAGSDMSVQGMAEAANSAQIGAGACSRSDQRFHRAGNDLDVADRAEAENISARRSTGRTALIATMKRNRARARADSGWQSGQYSEPHRGGSVVMKLDRRTLLGLSGYALAREPGAGQACPGRG